MRIVNTFLKKELPVIEINLETAIDKGNNLQVLEKSEVALPKLFNEFYRLTDPEYKPPKEESKVQPKAPAGKTGGGMSMQTKAVAKTGPQVKSTSTVSKPKVAAKPVVKTAKVPAKEESKIASKK